MFEFFKLFENIPHGPDEDYSYIDNNCSSDFPIQYFRDEKLLKTIKGLFLHMIVLLRYI